MAQPVLYINGEALDVGTLSSITVERHNPLLSAGQQSYSYPFTIPRTARNERLLGFPARFQRSTPAARSFACTLMCGHVQRVGRLHINSIARDSYDCSMSYDTAELLRGYGKKKLRELKWLSPNFGDKETLASKVVDNFLGKSGSVLYGNAATFSLVVALESGSPPELPDAKMPVPSILNNFFWEGGSWRRQPMWYVDGGKMLELPSPFGLAPFLRVDYALRFIFEDILGYRLDFGQRAYNPLEHICLLHNTADAAVDGVLRFRQLVPDCTVEELVTSVENMFCSKLALDSKSNTVRWVLWKDYLRGQQAANGEMWVPLPDVVDGGAPRPYTAELLPYLEGDVEVELQARRAIKLTMQRNMQPLLQALSVATADEFYGEQVEIDYPTNLWGGVVDAAHEDVRGGTISSGGLSGALSSNTFNCFNAVEGGASEDMPVAAEHLPMLVNDGAVGAGTAPCYLFGASYFNSVPPPDPENPDKQKEDKKATQPLAFATFYHDDSLGCTVGTTVGVFQLPPHPLYVQSLRLHQQEGLLNAYHYLRDKLLRQGAYSLRATLDSRITIHENEVYLFDGQPVMVESVTETLGASTQEVKLQSIKIMDEIPDDDGH